jgi:hypothetical protein
MHFSIPTLTLFLTSALSAPVPTPQVRTPKSFLELSLITQQVSLPLPNLPALDPVLKIAGPIVNDATGTVGKVTGSLGNLGGGLGGLGVKV